MICGWEGNTVGLAEMTPSAVLMIKSPAILHGSPKKRKALNQQAERAEKEDCLYL